MGILDLEESVDCRDLCRNGVPCHFQHKKCQVFRICVDRKGSGIRDKSRSVVVDCWHGSGYQPIRGLHSKRGNSENQLCRPFRYYILLRKVFRDGLSPSDK
jgi:hypothetical protein